LASTFSGLAFSGAAGGSSLNMGGISITINAAPGQNERQIADIVMRKLAEAQQQQQSRARSRLYDDSGR
jgi:hypothetical protein